MRPDSSLARYGLQRREVPYHIADAWQGLEDDRAGLWPWRVFGWWEGLEQLCFGMIHCRSDSSKQRPTLNEIARLCHKRSVEFQTQI